MAKKVSVSELIDWFELFAKYGWPALSKAYETIKASHDEPTVEEVRAIMEGVEPPEDYSGASGPPEKG